MTIVEFFGGLFLVIGLIVPVVSLFVAIQMAAITAAKKLKLHGAYVSMKNPVKYEIDILYLLLALTLMVLGAGILSVDGLLGL